MIFDDILVILGDFEGIFGKVEVRQGLTITLPREPQILRKSQT